MRLNQIDDAGVHTLKFNHLVGEDFIWARKFSLIKLFIFLKRVRTYLKTLRYTLEQPFTVLIISVI